MITTNAESKLNNDSRTELHMDPRNAGTPEPVLDSSASILEAHSESENNTESHADRGWAWLVLAGCVYNMVRLLCLFVCKVPYSFRNDP